MRFTSNFPDGTFTINAPIDRIMWRLEQKGLLSSSNHPNKWSREQGVILKHCAISTKPSHWVFCHIMLCSAYNRAKTN